MIETETLNDVIAQKTYSELLRNARLVYLQAKVVTPPTIRNEALNSIRDAVVKILDNDQWVVGTGFFVAPRLIITAGKQPRPFWIQLENGETHVIGRKPDSLLVYNKFLGLTLAKVDTYKTETYLTAREAQNLSPAATACSLYYTRDVPSLQIFRCVYSREEDLVMLYYNGSTAPGSSGAPVFSINNPSEAIGVHIGESNKSSFDAMFVDISSVAGWLRNQLAYCESPVARQSLVMGMDLQTAPDLTPRQVSDSLQITKKVIRDDSLAPESSVGSRGDVLRQQPEYNGVPATVLPASTGLALQIVDDLREIDLGLTVPPGYALISAKDGVFLTWDRNAILWSGQQGVRWLQPSKVERRYHCLARIGSGSVLVISGCNSKTCDRYSLAPGVSFGVRSGISECVRTRAYATATVHSGSVYVVGGVGHQSIEHLSLDTATPQWTEIAHLLPCPAINTAVIPISQDQLYIFGGSLPHTLVFNCQTGYSETKPDHEVEGAAFVGHSPVGVAPYEWQLFSIEGVLYTIQIDPSLCTRS